MREQEKYLSKEQEKAPEKGNPKEMGVSHLPNEEFKEIVIRVLIQTERNLGRRSTKESVKRTKQT